MLPIFWQYLNIWIGGWTDHENKYNVNRFPNCGLKKKFSAMHMLIDWRTLFVTSDKYKQYYKIHKLKWNNKDVYMWNDYPSFVQWKGKGCESLEANSGTGSQRVQ